MEPASLGGGTPRPHISTPDLHLCFNAAGPGGADITQWRDAQAKQFGSSEPLRMYSAMLTSHFYTHKSTSQGISHTDFLEEKSVGIAAPCAPCTIRAFRLS